MKLSHALLIASMMILQSCAFSNQTKPPAAGPIVQVAPPFDPGHYYAEDTAPDRPKIPRVELYNPSVSAVPPRAVAEVQQILAQYGITQTVKTCDVATSTEPCWDYLEDWVNDDTDIPAWQTDFKDISSTLKNCKDTGRYLSLGLPMDPRIFNNTPVMQVNDAEVFVLDTYCVDASAVTNLANRKPPVRIHILNRALLNLSIATPASSHTEVTKAVDIPGTFHARFLNFKADYSMSADFPTIQLDADQGYAGDGTTKIMLDDASRAKIQIQVLPAAHSLWEGLYNIGPTLTDIPQTPFRAAASSESGLVQPANGGVWLTHLDQELGLAQTRDSLSLARTYNSQNDQFGPFGYSWSAPFAERQKYFRFDSATGEVGPLTKLTFLGDGRFFSRELGPFFDPDRPELKPDIKKTNLFYAGEAGYEAESFTLNGIQTSRCDTISKNCLTFFSAGNRISFVGDQIFFRNTPAAIKQVLDTLHSFDTLADSKPGDDVRSNLRLDVLLSDARQKFNYTNGRSLTASPDIHGHFVYFVWGAKTIKWAVYSTGKVIRYVYGEPTGALTKDGEFLREVRGIVSERSYSPTISNEFALANIPSDRAVETVYYRYYYHPRDLLTNWTGGLLKSVDSYMRRDEVKNIEYTDPIKKPELGLYGYAPIAIQVVRDEMLFSYSYDFKNSDRSKVCDKDKVYSVRELTSGQNGRILPRKYVLDRTRGILLESYGPTETRDYSGDNNHYNRLLQVSLDPKTLKIASKVVRGRKISNAFSNGLLATSTTYRPNIYASVCDSSGDIDPKFTVYNATKVIRSPYFFDLSGAEVPTSVTYPDVVKQGGQIVKRTVSQISGSKPSCSGGIGITYDSSTQVTSGTECRVAANPLGGSDVWTYAKATFMGEASSELKFERDELKPLSIESSAFYHPYDYWNWKQSDYWLGVHRPDFVSQVGFIDRDRLNGVTKINTGSGLVETPMIRKYRDAYGNVVFTQHPLGGVTRYLWSNRYPSPLLQATFTSEASVPSPTSSPTPDLEDLYSLLRKVDDSSATSALKLELQKTLRVCAEGDPRNCGGTVAEPKLLADTSVRDANMYHTLRLSSGTIYNSDYPQTAPAIQFKAGSPVTKFEYDNATALLTKTTQYLSGGYKKDASDELKFDDASIFTIWSSPVYCKDLSATRCFAPRSIVGAKDSKGTETTTHYRDGHDFGAFKTITNAESTSGLITIQSSGGDLGLEYDDFGNNLRTVIERVGETDAAKRESITYSYNSWLNIDTTTHTLDIAEKNSLSGRSESTRYHYYDDAAGLIQMTQKTGFFDPTYFVTSYEYDNALKPVRIDDESTQKTTEISHSGTTASWDRKVVQIEKFLKTLNSSDLTMTSLKSISRMDGLGNMIESCTGTGSDSCSDKESTTRVISPFGYTSSASRKVKLPSGGSFQSVVIKSTPDSFGQPLLERESEKLDRLEWNTDSKLMLKVSRPDNYLWKDYSKNYDIWNGTTPFPSYINQQLVTTAVATFGFTRPCEATSTGCGSTDLSSLNFEFKPLEYNKSVTHPLGMDVYTCQSNSNKACADNSHAESLLSFSTISISPAASIVQEKVDLNSGTTARTSSLPNSQGILLFNTGSSSVGNSQIHQLDPILGTTISSIDRSIDPWGGDLKQVMINQQSDALGRPSGVLQVKEGDKLTKETSFVYNGNHPSADSVTTTNHLFDSRGIEAGSVTTTTNYTYMDGVLEHLPISVEILSNSSATGGSGNQSGRALQTIKYSGSGEPQETTYAPVGPSDLDQILVESTMSSETSADGQLISATTDLKFHAPSGTNTIGDLKDVDGSAFNRNPSEGFKGFLPVDGFKTKVEYFAESDTFENVAARKISMKVDGFKIADFTIGDGQYRRTAGRILRIKTGLADPVYVSGVDLEQMGIEPTSGKIDDGGFFSNLFQRIFGSDRDLNLTSMGLDLRTTYGGSINLAGPKGYNLGFENTSSGYYLKTASPKSNTPFGVSLSAIPHSVSAMTPPSPTNFDTSCDSMQMAATRKFSTSGDGANYVYNRENPIINSRLSQVRPQIASFEELPPAATPKPTVLYDERGLKRQIKQGFTIPATSTLPEQNWVIIRNYSHDAQGNPTLVEVITYFKGGNAEFRNWTPIAITQYINNWLPTPDAMVFGRKYFLARQLIRDGIYNKNPEVRLKPFEPANDSTNPVIHHAHPLFKTQGDSAGQTDMSSLFYFVPSDQGPIAGLRLIQDYSQCYAGSQATAFNADGSTPPNPPAIPGVRPPSDSDSTLNPIAFGPVRQPTFCAYRATYDQLGNFMGLGKYKGTKRTRPTETNHNQFLPPPDLAMYSPYGTATHLRVSDENASRSGDTYRYDIDQSEVYLDSDPRFAMFPTFGAQGEFSDGLLSGMVYDSFSGRMIRNEGSYYESTSSCAQSQNVKTLVGKFLAMGKGITNDTIFSGGTATASQAERAREIFAKRELDISSQLGFMNLALPGLGAAVANAYTRLEMNHSGLQIHRTGADALAGGLLEAGYMIPVVGSCGLGVTDSLLGHQYGQTAMNAGYCALDIAGLFTGGGSTAASTAARVGTRSAVAGAVHASRLALDGVSTYQMLSGLSELEE